MNLIPLQHGLAPVNANTSYTKNPFTTRDAVNSHDAINELANIDDRLTSVASKPEDMENFGWNVPQGADVLQTYRNGNDAATFTPVIDGGDFLTQSQMSHYADDVLTGRTDDYLGLQRGPVYGNSYDAEKQRRNIQYLQQLLSAERQNNLYLSQYPRQEENTSVLGYSPLGDEVNTALERYDPVELGGNLVDFEPKNRLSNLSKAFGDYLASTTKISL